MEARKNVSLQTKNLRQVPQAKWPIITIPVVVHIVFNKLEENITDAQIDSQIVVLNQDFRRKNSDAVNTPSVWQHIAADTKIEFRLEGITRTQTYTTSFSSTFPDNQTAESIKLTSKGGKDPWDQARYLNIWVCPEIIDLGDPSNDILGYASLPSKPIPRWDGVVIGYTYFGTLGTVLNPFNKGRTLTHEVGHWLNLPHIWGKDGVCEEDDGFTDTPIQYKPN